LFLKIESEVAYENMKDPFFIGNQSSNLGFFFGDIREIKIANNIIDTKEIETIWGKIKNNNSLLNGN